MAKKTLAYFTVPFEGLTSKPSVTKWLRDNKFTVKTSGNTLVINRKTSVDPIQVADELQHHFPGCKRTSNVSVNVRGIAIKIDAALTGNAGQANEFYLMNTINHYCNVLGPIKLIFADTHGKKLEIDKVIGSSDVGTDTKDNKKADILIHTKTKSVPLSLKQGNASFFGSIDAAFKGLLKNAIGYAIKHRKLDKHEFKNSENRISPHIAIEPSAKEQEFFLFGSDIIKDKGAIIKQTFKQDNFEHQLPNTLVVYVDRVWKSLKDVDEHDRAAIEIRNQTGRNRSDKEISGLRILATVKSKIPKNAVWLNRAEFA